MALSDITLLDGGMGTQLQAAGLPVGQLPELWNLTEPEKVTAVHRRYVEAGSRVLYTNTFGVNGLKAARFGHSVSELVKAGVRCARAADRGEGILVALDIGPLGQILEPLGTLRFEEAYELFREIVIAGRDAGADLIVIETMSDLYEVKAAVLAAKENSCLPVWTTMTFGFNCSLGPKELLPLVRELRQWTDLPLILKPNAGLPDPATGEYRLTPEDFAEELLPALQEGIAYLGGCCGTTPDFIRVLRERLASPALSGGQAAGSEKPPRKDGICSATNTAVFDGVRVIGERINPTGKKRFQQALREQDLDYIVARGLEQQDAGADILDVNVGLPGIDEPAMMARTVKALQAVIDLPLQIDSSNPEAIEAGLRAVNGRAIVNSVSGKAESLETILPLCRKYGAKVVGLCLDENGIPETWQARAF